MRIFRGWLMLIGVFVGFSAFAQTENVTKDQEENYEDWRYEENRSEDAQKRKYESWRYRDGRNPDAQKRKYENWRDESEATRKEAKEADYEDWRYDEESRPTLYNHQFMFGVHAGVTGGGDLDSNELVYGVHLGIPLGRYWQLRPTLSQYGDEKSSTVSDLSGGHVTVDRDIEVTATEINFIYHPETESEGTFYFGVGPSFYILGGDGDDEVAGLNVLIGGRYALSEKFSMFFEYDYAFIDYFDSVEFDHGKALLGLSFSP